MEEFCLPYKEAVTYSYAAFLAFRRRIYVPILNSAKN